MGHPSLWLWSDVGHPAPGFSGRRRSSPSDARFLLRPAASSWGGLRRGFVTMGTRNSEESTFREAFEVLPLFDDFYLQMQALNLDLVDQVISAEERDLL